MDRGAMNGHFRGSSEELRNRVAWAAVAAGISTLVLSACGGGAKTTSTPKDASSASTETSSTSTSETTTTTEAPTDPLMEYGNTEWLPTKETEVVDISDFDKFEQFPDSSRVQWALEVSDLADRCSPFFFDHLDQVFADNNKTLADYSPIKAPLSKSSTALEILRHKLYNDQLQRAFDMDEDNAIDLDISKRLVSGAVDINTLDGTLNEEYDSDIKYLENNTERGRYKDADLNNYVVKESGTIYRKTDSEGQEQLLRDIVYSNSDNNYKMTVKFVNATTELETWNGKITTENGLWIVVNDKKVDIKIVE